MSETAISRRELPREIQLVMGDAAISEDVVRAALMSAYKDCPAPEVARALVKCARHGLDPLGDHVAIFKPRGSDRWAVYLTLKAYEEIASRHPDFGALTYTDFVEVDNEVRIGCYVHRKSFPTPSGPFWGRSQKMGTKSRAKGGGTYKIEWAYEVAQSRARRAALRAALGLNIPDDDLGGDAPGAKLRDDQRRRLFALAARMGWDDDARHARAAAVLGREVASWADLSEDDGVRLEVAWQGIESAIEVDPETGEVLGNRPLASAQGEQAPPSAAPERIAPADVPSSEPPPTQGPIEDAGAPITPQEDARATVLVTAAPASAAPHPATRQQLTALAILAQRLGWDRDERLRRAGVDTFSDLDRARASALINQWSDLAEAGESEGEAEESATSAARSTEPPRGAASEPERHARDAGRPAAAAPPAQPDDDADRELALQRATAALDALFGPDRHNPDRRAFVYRQASVFHKTPGELDPDELVALARAAEGELQEAPL